VKSVTREMTVLVAVGTKAVEVADVGGSVRGT